MPTTPDSRATVSSGPLGLFGGTFDPVHCGHLRVALAAAQALALPEVRLIPSRTPVHRPQPGATAEQRLAMLRLAVADDATGTLRVDDRELRRHTPSYTVPTLEALRAEVGAERALVWLLGADAFGGLMSWHRWPALFDLAHLVVLNRPGSPAEALRTPALAPVWQGRLNDDLGVLRTQPHGALCFLEVAPQDISATAIRNLIAGGAPDTALAALLPPAVLAYIRAHHLYRLRQVSLAPQ
ncbi:MAG: nicotinate-nucleotide adenylyltransferase [Proteobacteria bacterium]|nr:nicotinate-nucleotide adenylyltransferase [Pseudomonadota bacterium]